MRRILRRLAFVLVACAVVIAAGLAGLYFAFTENFKLDAPTPDYAKPRSALDAQRQDLNYFRKVMALDRSFSPAARAQAERQIAALEGAPEATPQQKLHVALMRIMALADNGHTRVRASITGKTVLVLLVYVARFAEGFFVM